MQVRKRTGQIEEFDISKVAKAIYKARLDANVSQTLEESFIEARKVLNHLNKEIVEIEEIQDAIESNFIKNDEIEVFKAFTFYREMRRQDRINPWANNDERQDLILEKYLIKGETKKEFLERISLNNHKLLKIFRNREGI
jgi:ribonucleoside-diphosphate reductase alpha chain